MKKILKNFLKNILTGRKLNIIDKLIFNFSRKEKNGWLIGNKIRNKLSGRRKSISTFPIIMVGGCPRSGTTLIQNVLKICKGVGGPYEEICVFQDVKDYELIKNAFDIEKGKLTNMIKKSKKDNILLAEFILKKYMKKRKIKYIILKAPKNVLFLEEIFKYFPHVKYINIVRDGRDVVVSMKKFFKEQLKENHPIDVDIRTWVTCINQANKFKKKTNKFIEIKYEEFVENPEEQIKNICKFIGLVEPNKKELNQFYKKINISKIKNISESHSKQLSQPLYKKSIGNWKNKLTNEQKEIFKQIAGETLIKKGYEKDLKW